MIDAYASRQHYAAHIRPVMDALPAEHRGIFTTRGQPHGTGPVLIAAAHDLAAVRGRPVALISHGVDQRYEGHDGPAYAGGTGRDHIDLFLCPNIASAAANARAYPDARCEVVGTPALDPWFAGDRADIREPELVVMALHWNCEVVPETRSALEHYRTGLVGIAADLAASGRTLALHGHPRIASRVEMIARTEGIPYVHEWSSVLDMAGVLCVDNSSVAWEGMAVGVPVVWLDAPWYRSDAGHPAPWAWRPVTGPVVADAAGVVPAVRWVEQDARPQHLLPTQQTWIHERERAVGSLYPFRDGRCADRAARVLVEWASGLT